MSLLLAGINALLIVFAGMPPTGWFNVVVFAAVGFGVHRMSRTAAVAGFALYALGQLYGIVALGQLPGVVAIVALFLFLSAARGTFAYHRLRKRGAPPSAASG